MTRPRTRPAAWPPLVFLACLTPAVGFAQNAAPTAEQYQDALNQLKAAQDRKNELATENQKLHQRTAELEKKLADTGDRLSTLEGHVYDLREHYEAWRQFVDANPRLKAMWLAFYTAPATEVQKLLGDGQWPFSVEG